MRVLTPPGFPQPLPSNSANRVFTASGHLFIEDYIAEGQSTRDTIVRVIIDARDALAQARMAAQTASATSPHGTASAGPAYSITELPEANEVVWQQLNNQGAVIGTRIAGGSVLYCNGNLVELGNAILTSLNDLGQAAGMALSRTIVVQVDGRPVQVPIWTAVRTAPYTPLNLPADDLGIFPGQSADVLHNKGGSILSQALSINNGGQVVGGGLLDLGFYIAAWHAFLYSDEAGSMTDLGALGEIGTDRAGRPTFPGSLAFAVNNLGNVVGITGVFNDQFGDTNVRIPFLYRDGHMVDFNSLGGIQGVVTAVTAINDRDEVVGTSLTSGGQAHAFLYRDGIMFDLGTLAGQNGSEALDVNAFGEVVGLSSAGSDTRAFVYQDGVMFDLNRLIPADSCIFLTRATAINDQGDILALGYRADSTGKATDMCNAGGAAVILKRL